MVELVSCETDARWRSAAVASGQPVSAYHHPRFLRAAATGSNCTWVPLVVRHRGTDVGVATWLERRRGPACSVNRVPFPYAGPLVPPELLGATLRALVRRGQWRGAAVQTHQFPPGTAVDLEALRRAGPVTRDETFIVRTEGDAADVDRRISPRSRRYLRSAERNGVVAMHEPDPARAADALETTLQSIYADRAPSGYRVPLRLHPADFVGEGLQVQWLVATLEGQVLGCLVSLAWEGSAIAWLGGVDPAHRASHAGLVLYRTALDWAQRLGARGLDLSGNPTPQIATFKRQLGGELHDYPRMTHQPIWGRSARGAVTAASRIRTRVASLR